MTLGELIASYRDESRDNVAPLLVSDTSLIQFANQGQVEACRRAHLLIDSSAIFCAVDVSANEPLVDIDPRIINIRRAKLSISTYSLSPVRAEEMDNVNPGWELHVGTPTTYVTDYQTNAIRLYPNQQIGAKLTMTVSRLPMNSMEDKEDEPEIREEYHPALVQWMLYRAYSKQDADMFDPNKAALALAEFEKEFGKSTGGRNERWQNERHTIDTPTIA